MPGHGQPAVYNRTFMGIFGDISQDPTAGSVLLADKDEPAASFSPPRRYARFAATSGPVAMAVQSPTHPGMESGPFRPTMDTVTTPLPGSELLHRMSPKRKSAMDTLRGLGLAPVIDEAAGANPRKPSWFLASRPASGDRAPTAKTGLLAGKPENKDKEFAALGLAPRMD